MEIEKLTRYTPLIDTNKWESEYVKVVTAKELTFTTNTDVCLTMYIVFSVDGKTDGQEHKFKLPSGWSSRNMRRSLPYCKVILINETGISNDILVLSVLSDKVIKQDPEKPPAELIEDHETRSKSPFRSILSRRKKSIPSNILQNCKVPEHVPKNALLCGDWDGKLKVIPPPISGIGEVQLLTFQNGSFEWIILSEDEKKDKNVSWRFD